MPQESPEVVEEKRFQGIPVAAGISIARVFVHWEESDEIPVYPVARELIPGEIARLEAALLATRTELVEIQKRIEESLGAQDASIFEAHLLVLEDRMILDEVVRTLHKDEQNVEAVFSKVTDRFCESLAAIEDDYLRERAVDIEDVARRVLRHLLGKASESIASLDQPYILIAHNLTPSDTALLNRELVLGFATELGSKTSHTAIMARALEIPAVVGLHDICSQIRTGDEVLLDGYSGTIILHPSAQTREEYAIIETQKEKVEEGLELIRETTSTTRDGRHIILSANIELPDEIGEVIDCGAEGIGLFRTEFLFLNREEPPGEDEQFEMYRLIAERSQPHGVIIRTLDIGGDKDVDGLDLPEEENPFLGCRAIRYCLEHPELFKPQLRAILRAATAGLVRIMYPMISGVRELREANALLALCQEELRAEGIPCTDHIEIGAMIEIPSAAVAAAHLAPHVNFFSIGTNDLIQYSIAVDRGNDRIAHLYEPTHPAVLQLIRTTVAAAHQSNIWVGVCGEMAGDILLTPLLIGMDVDELSASPSLVPRVKKAVQSLDARACREFVESILSIPDPGEISARCGELAQAHYGDLLA